MDASFFDRPEILQFIFYPRKDPVGKPSVSNATDYFITVEEDIRIGCRFYTAGQNSPNILYFHGNGEIVADHDYIAPMYNQKGINLFVADYRGYGMSDGTPTFNAMMADAPILFREFSKILRENAYTGPLFLMGRSLGSASVIELAYHYQPQMKGLIIESGFANILGLFEHLGFPVKSFGFTEEPKFSNRVKARSISIPTLIIHAQHDQLIPLSEAQDLFNNLSTEDKRLMVIPQADHNTILVIGMEQYFRALEEFIFPLS
jgi:alpha-beta hydrolase superfamily lysophospholipase